MVLFLCNAEKSDSCIVHMAFSSDSGIFKGEICSTIWYSGLCFETKASILVSEGRKKNIPKALRTKPLEKECLFTSVFKLSQVD